MKSCLLARSMTLFFACVGCIGHAQAKTSAVFIISDNTLEATTLGNIRNEISELPSFPHAFGYSQVRLVDFIVDRMTDYFRVDRKTNLLTARALDRDKVCSLIGCCQLTICAVKFRVLISPSDSDSGTAPILKTVEVLLMDQNDQAPQFAPTSPLQIDEATPIGTQFALPEAKDGESLENSVQAYNLLDESFTFGLSMKQSRPFIKVLRPLDYEKQQSYQLVLKANDKLFSATTTLTVMILDVNDNAPVFHESRKTVTILESQKTNQPFIQVNATDADSGQNAHISYAIEDVNPTNMFLYFQINVDTGHVYLLKTMDYENDEIAKSTQIIITAQDAGLPRRSSSTTLIVLLNGIDDHAPIIRPIMSYKLVEESSKKQLVQIFSVRDPDQAVTTGLSCTLEHDSSLAEFQLIRRGGSNGASLLFDLYSVSVVNYEKSPIVFVTVICSDGLSNSRQTFNISVEEINEFVPQFETSFYTTSIAENLNVHRQVLRVHATDKDTGDAGKIFYKITKPNDFHYFRIDYRTGDVFVNAALDREVTPFVTFTIEATDFPGHDVNKQFSASALVNITLLDVNDEIPTYKGPPNLRILENQQIGHEVARLDFEDRDAGRNGSVHLSLLLDGNLANDFFELSASGSLRTKQSLDRETQSFLYIQVVAADGGQPSLSSTITLIINVEDENDNAPRLLSPAENETLSFALNSTAKVNSVVTQLRGTDADEPGSLNSKLQFTLLPSNGSSFFYLNKSSGLLTTKWGVDLPGVIPTPGIYELRVYLQDSSLNAPMHQITMFKVEIYVSNSGPIINAGTTNGLLILIFIIFTTAIIAFILLWLIWRTRREGIIHRNLDSLMISTEQCKASQQYISPIVTTSPTGTRLIRPLEEDSYCKEESHYTALTPIFSYSHCDSQNCYVPECGVTNEQIVEYSNHCSSLNRQRLAGLAATKFAIQQQERSARCPSIQSFGEAEADSGRGGSAEDLRTQINSYTSLSTARFNTFQARTQHSANLLIKPKAPSLPSSLVQPLNIPLNEKMNAHKESETRI